METNDRLLRRALLAQLRQEPAFVLRDAADGDGNSSDVVLSTTTDLPTDRCKELVSKGARVIVLAAIPKKDECARYQLAGARAYIPMTADGVSLLKEIREAVS